MRPSRTVRATRGLAVVTTSRAGSTSWAPQLQQARARVLVGSVMLARPQDAQSTTVSSTWPSASRHCDSRTRRPGSCSPSVKLCSNSRRSTGGVTDQFARTPACSSSSGRLAASAGSKTNTGRSPYSRRSAASSRQRIANASRPSSGWWFISSMNSSTASECRSVWVDGRAPGSRRISSGAMNFMVPLIPAAAVSGTALSLSQIRIEPSAGSMKTLPQEMSR